MCFIGLTKTSADVKSTMHMGHKMILYVKLISNKTMSTCSTGGRAKERTVKANVVRRPFFPSSLSSSLLACLSSRGRAICGEIRAFLTFLPKRHNTYTSCFNFRTVISASEAEELNKFSCSSLLDAVNLAAST